MKSSVVHGPQGHFPTIDKISMISLQAETDNWSILLDKEPFYYNAASHTEKPSCRRRCQGKNAVLVRVSGIHDGESFSREWSSQERGPLM